MQPDPSTLLEKMNMDIPLIGFYDAPDQSPFEPLVAPKRGRHACLFAFYRQWLQGKTLHLTDDNFGCGGAGHWLLGVEGRSHEAYIEFLVDEEGLKASHALMGQWLDENQPYQPEYPHLLIGPLLEDQYPYLKTITFMVDPDQLSLLIIGAHYHTSPQDPSPVIVPFGSGCMELVSLFDDLSIPQAVLGTTDIAMRKYIDPDLLAFTVTKPMFQKLCELDEESFLYKPFWKNLQVSR